jgi:hypothetical protein
LHLKATYAKVMVVRLLNEGELPEPNTLLKVRNIVEGES